MIGVSFCCSTGHSGKYITFQIAAIFMVPVSLVLEAAPSSSCPEVQQVETIN
jgi:hypothetical protein